MPKIVDLEKVEKMLRCALEIVEAEFDEKDTFQALAIKGARCIVNLTKQLLNME